MQTDLVRLLRAKSGVIGLDARTPDLAVIGAQQQFGMRIHRQEQATTATIGTVITNIVIGKRGVIVPDQQTILIGEVLDPIRLGIREAEVIGTGAQAVVIATYLRNSAK